MAFDLMQTNINIGFYENQSVSLVQVQGDDDSRTIHIRFLDKEGRLFEPPADDTYITFRMHTAKGHDFIYSTMEGGGDVITPTIRTEGTGENAKKFYQSVDLVFNENMLSDSGVAYGQLVFSNSTQAISTTRFEIFVEESVSFEGTEASSDYALLAYLAANAKASGADLKKYSIAFKTQEANWTNKFNEWGTEATSFVKQTENLKAEAESLKTETQNLYNSTVAYNNEAKSYAEGDASREGSDTDNAKYYSDIAKSYAIGDTNISHGEISSTEDNAKYYSDQLKNLTDTLGEKQNQLNEDIRNLYDQYRNVKFEIDNDGNLTYNPVTPPEGGAG